MNSKEELNKIDLTSFLGDFWKTARRFFLLLVLCVPVFAALFYLKEKSSYVPQYQSQATFTVSTDGSAFVSRGSSGSEQVKESLPYILRSDVMKNMVMEDLGMSSFPASVELESRESANFYVLRVTSADAQLSQKILDSMLDQVLEASVYVLGKIQIEVLDASGTPSLPVNYRNTRMSLLKGAAYGFFLWAVFAACYTLTSHTIQREEDFKKYLSVPCIAIVPRITFKKRRKAIDRHIHIYNDKVNYSFAEAMRTVRTRVLREAERIGAQVLLVTSSVPGEGKSTIAANLALSLAERGKKTVLVDLDLRNPSVAKVLGLETQAKAGMAEVLLGTCSVLQAVQKIPEWGLFLLPGGAAQADPAALFNGKKLESVLNELEKQFDYVILDTSPAAMLADASAVARCADGAVYVVKQDYARIERITEGLDMLTFARVPVLGAILNHAERMPGSYNGYGGYRYGHYGRYGSYGEYGQRVREKEAGAEYIDVSELPEVQDEKEV